MTTLFSKCVKIAGIKMSIFALFAGYVTLWLKGVTVETNSGGIVPGGMPCVQRATWRLFWSLTWKCIVVTLVIRIS